MLIALLAVCSVLTLTFTSGSGIATASLTPAGISWSPCPKVTGYLCGSLHVPIDYGHPSRGTLSLAVIEHPVPDSKGVIVFNPGGPGESGVLILPILASFVPTSVRSQFTLVSFDERGTGSSDPLLCGPTPAAASSAVAGTLAAATYVLRSGSLMSFPLSRAVPDRGHHDFRSGYEQSPHGSRGRPNQLLRTVLWHCPWVRLPAAVPESRALDGARRSGRRQLESPQQMPHSKRRPSRRRSSMHSPVVRRLSGCALGSNPVGSYEQLAARLTQTPLPPPGDGDNIPVTVGDLMTATLLYLSAPTLTPGYFPALSAAIAGNGAPLRSVALGLETDLNGNSLVGALWSITCNDAAAHPNGAATASLARTLAARFPLGGAEAVANNLIGCPGWTGSTGAVAHLAPIRSQPPLIIGNTYDPNTPYAVARRLAPAVGGRLVTYVGYGHSWLLNGSANICMQEVVSSYLIDGTLPAPGTRCASSDGN